MGQRLVPTVDRSRWLWWLLALALWAPVWGQMHRSLHGSHLLVTGAAPVEQSSSGLTVFFSGHSRADCLWLDAVTLGSSPTSALAISAQLVPLPVLLWVALPIDLARHCVAFDARAPPAF